MSASTGIVLLDLVMRPFLKIGVKFPMIGLFILTLVYGYIAYIVVKSAFAQTEAH